MIQPRTSPPKFAPSPRPESNTVKKQSEKHRVKKQSETQSEQQTEKTVLSTAVQNCVNASVPAVLAGVRRRSPALLRRALGGASLCELLPVTTLSFVSLLFFSSHLLPFLRTCLKTLSSSSPSLGVGGSGKGRRGEGATRKVTPAVCPRRSSYRKPREVAAPPAPRRTEALTQF